MRLLLVQALGYIADAADALGLLLASRSVTFSCLRSAALTSLGQDGAAQLLLDARILAGRRDERQVFVDIA